MGRGNPGASTSFGCTGTTRRPQRRRRRERRRRRRRRRSRQKEREIFSSRLDTKTWDIFWSLGFVFLEMKFLLAALGALLCCSLSSQTLDPTGRNVCHDVRYNFTLTRTPVTGLDFQNKRPVWGLFWWLTVAPLSKKEPSGTAPLTTGHIGVSSSPFNWFLFNWIIICVQAPLHLGVLRRVASRRRRVLRPWV